MTIDSQSVKGHTELQKLKDQISLLTEKVASLSTRQSGYQQQSRQSCFDCGQIGHVQNCLQSGQSSEWSESFVLLFWPVRPLSKKLLVPGKQTNRDAYSRKQESLSVSPTADVMTVTEGVRLQ